MGSQIKTFSVRGFGLGFGVGSHTWAVHGARTSGRAMEKDSNTETYDGIEENQFHDAKENPLSTFSIDVDTASYSNVRRFLQNEELPAAGAVRIEELINYFSYGYPEPKAGDPFSVSIEVSRAVECKARARPNRAQGAQCSCRGTPIEQPGVPR